MRYLVLAAITGCIYLPHVPPVERTPATAIASAVRVETWCEEDGPLGYVEWGPHKVGTGVVISERHVLTAAHVVTCPVFPRVRVTLQDGRRFSMAVERDDIMFGEGRDVARLVMASADRFDLGIAPPVLTAPDSRYPARIAVRGTGRLLTGRFMPPHYVYYTPTQPGDSGAGVYDIDGGLVGIVVAGDQRNITQYEPIDTRWLEGT